MFAPVVFSEKENEMDSSRIQYDRWLSQPSLDASLRAELSAMADDAHAIDNAFGCELTFGTGGLRGILGSHLGGIRGVLLGTSEAALTG